jgi:hypothetical protein
MNWECHNNYYALCDVEHYFLELIRGDMRVYPKVSRLATQSENCKWYSSLPLGAVILLFVSV